MPAPLLTTKLYIPPPRPNRVPRPRLIERLDEGLRLGHRLTLVSAPAGFGKTTLVTEWLHNADRPSTWLSLDEGDNDPIRFLTYLAAALQQVEGATGQAVQSLLAAPQPQLPPIESLVTALINDIAATDTAFALVLDDYHLVQTEAIHKALQFLLKHQPPQIHLVIVARQDPPLPLPRLRVRGQVTEIRERDLRFTEEEAAAFIRQTMGLNLPPEDLATLSARTEGWIAGLQLAALSLQDQKDAEDFIAAFAGDNRYVVDYLAEEVLHRQPEAIQSFLLRTSILNRLSAPLCDALVSDLELPNTSQAILEQLDASNLFVVPLDNRRAWYRYHRLFADLLRYRLRREHPDRPADLHRRASRWCEQADDADEAIHHALAIPDFPLVAHLAEQYGLRMVGSSRLATFLSWVRRIPEDVITTRPHLCAHCGWAFVLTGQVEAAERYVQVGEAALSDFERLYVTPEYRFVTQEEVRGNLAAVRAYCARLRGDMPGVIEHSQQAREQLPADAFTVRCVVALNLGLLRFHSGNLDAAQAAFVEAFEMALRSEENMFVAVSALSLQGDILAFQGKLRAAVEHYHQVIELGTEGTGTPFPVPAIGMGHLGLAMAHYQRNELATAAHHLEKGLALARQVGNSEAVVGVYLAQAQFAMVAGDLTRAEVLLDQAGELVRPYGTTSRFYTSWMAIRAKLYLAQDDTDAAAQCVAACDLQAAELTPQDLTGGGCWARLPEYLLLPRVLLAQGRRRPDGTLDEALDLLEPLVTAAEAGQYVAVLIEATILQALAWHLKRHNVRALEYLERALALAAPEGYVRPFLDAGGPMHKLLRQAASRGIAPDHVSELLASFSASEYEKTAAKPSRRHTQPLIEPLSKREREVLRLVAAGLSNREIAQELVIAVSTVKSHANHIFNKLDVKSRTQAVVRAKELGLL